MQASHNTGFSPAYKDPTRQSGTNYIRLIRLIPGPPEGPIVCTLHNVNLEQPGNFTALSYTWGEPYPTVSIVLNGHPVEVRKNLWDFLNQTRSSGRRNLLWIDAISINQGNIHERNHQVGLMSQIYSKATNVIVWLGMAIKDSNAVMRNLRALQDDPRSISYLRAYDRSLSMFFCHPYWSRLWVQQEFILAKQVEIFWGFMSIDTVTVDLIVSLVRPTILAVSTSPAMKPFRDRVQWRSNCGNNPGGLPGIDFVTLLLNSITLSCLDLRDHFFGILGITRLDQLEQLDITPDYSQSVETLYKSVVSKIRLLYPDHLTHLHEHVLAKKILGTEVGRTPGHHKP